MSKRSGVLIAITFLVSYLLLLMLYGAIGLYSNGYDDEFYNIFLVEKYGFNLLSIVQSTDVHPPGSYLINFLLFKIFGDWSYVRATTGVCAASIFSYAIHSMKSRHGALSGIFAFVFLGLNPALLLWCTGLRWYAYFVPIVAWLLITPRTAGVWYWAKFSLGLILLAYIGYAAIIMAPAILWLYYSSSHATKVQRFKGAALAIGSASIIYSHQFFVFLTVHYHNKGSQVSSIGENLRGFAVAQIGNQGIFPISIAGILSSCGIIGIFFLYIKYVIKHGQRSEFFMPYIITSICLIGSGLAGKFRNFVIISPLQALWISSLPSDLMRQRLFLIFAGILSFANFFGVYNVATHQNTTKNSWNLPSNEVIQLAVDASRRCVGRPYILTHDPTLTYLFQRRGFVVVGPYSRFIEKNLLDEDFAECLFVIKTYAGSISDDRIEAMYKAISELTYCSREVKTVGRDANFRIKQRLDHRYPEYQVEFTVMRGVHGVTRLSPWLPTSK